MHSIRSAVVRTISRLLYSTHNIQAAVLHRISGLLQCTQYRGCSFRQNIQASVVCTISGLQLYTEYLGCSSTHKIGAAALRRISRISGLRYYTEYRGCSFTQNIWAAVVCTILGLQLYAQYSRFAAVRLEGLYRLFLSHGGEGGGKGIWGGGTERQQSSPLGFDGRSYFSPAEKQNTP